MKEDAPVERLTPREIEVLKLIATGLSTKQIARSLNIAFKTAACHRARVMGKLGIHEVANLTRYAIRNGYVDSGGASTHPNERQAELLKCIKVAELKYRTAMNEYGAFLRDRESIGLATPDGSDGARKLRRAEQAAHEEYHAALVALKELLSRQWDGKSA